MPGSIKKKSKGVRVQGQISRPGYKNHSVFEDDNYLAKSQLDIVACLEDLLKPRQVLLRRLPSY